VSNSDAVEETCIGQDFSAQCRQGETILMSYASLGRMKLGKCIQTEFGHLGCQKNVISKFDYLCSGKSTCSIQKVAIQDFEDSASGDACPGGLMVYLATTFACVTGKCVQALFYF
jgi:hypothetical protein